MKGIELGQKLQTGDYFKNGTLDQYKELFAIEDSTYNEQELLKYAQLSVNRGFVGFTAFSKKLKMLTWKNSQVKKYSFEDFKQLCINTFKINK